MKKRLLFGLSLIIVLSMILTACGPAEIAANNGEEEITASEEIETGEEVEETTAETEEIEESGVVESDTPSKLVISLSDEPDTLDPHKTAKTSSDQIMAMLGGSLVAINFNGEIIPYLAKSWEVSEDGLTYTFNLRDDVLFHNGDALTAQDYVFTIERALDPETASPVAGPMLATIESVKAVDDYTLELSMAEPFFPFLITLATPGYLQPVNQAYLEEVGEDEFGRNPISVGPYKMAEWQTGDRIVLEVNPEYTWGPEELGSGPFQIDTIEYRLIVEYATIMAGLEAGEIDIAGVNTSDLPLFTELPFDQVSGIATGCLPHLAFNTIAEPFTDVNVRKALSMAIDRQSMLDVMANGNGVVQYGPLSQSIIGYWEGVEDIGLKYNPEEAKALLEESGYVLNENGIYEKDGKTLSFTLTAPSSEENTKFAELAQAMFGEIGVEMTIEMIEPVTAGPKIVSGDYEMAVFGWGYTEADILYMIFHSSQIGGLNYFMVNDPELDAVLESTRTLTDPEERQQAVNEAQRIITENAYLISAYSAESITLINQRVKNYGFSQFTDLIFNQAYIE